MEERYKELMQYEDSVNAYRDIVNAINTATKDGYIKGRAEGKAEGRAEGRAEGMLEGKLEIARNMLLMGMTAKDIANITGLSGDDIENLQ